MYLKLKQYINNNKHLLIMFLTSTCFILIYNVAFCNPVVLMTLLPSVANKFIDKAFEVAPYFADKAIAATPYVAYCTGWLILGSTLTIAGIKTLEYGYNWRYIANQTTNSIPIVGWTASGLQWGYEKITGAKIKSVEYTYFLPKIASVLGDPKFFTKKIVFDLNTQSANMITDQDMVREVEVEKFKFVDRIEKQIEYIERPVYRNITEFVDKPVYIPVIEYRDRENLVSLDEGVDKLASIGQDLIFIQNQTKTRDEIIQEFLSLREHENAVCLKLNDLEKLYKSHTINSATDDFVYSFAPMPIRTLTFDIPQNEFCFSFGEIGTTVTVALSTETFKTKYPSIYRTFLFLSENIPNRTHYIHFAYNVQRTLFSSNYSLDIQNSFFSNNSNDYKTNVISKVEEVFLFLSHRTNNDLITLAGEIREKIVNEQRLITNETQEQGAQTANFDLNETIYDRISSFLEVRDETSLIVASQESRNLPFNNMQIQSYAKPKETVGTQTQETSIETQTQAELNVSESTGTLGVSTINSSIFQQMGTFFGTVLVGAVVHDFQTLDLVARSLLGFIHIPEYNQAFIAATQMSIVDLQMTYNFEFEEAQKAYQSLEIAKELRVSDSLPSDLSSQLSDSNNYPNQTQGTQNIWGLKDYLLLTTGLIIASGTVYFMYQSVKNGTYTQETNNITEGVLSSFDVWEKQYIDKIRKL